MTDVPTAGPAFAAELHRDFRTLSDALGGTTAVEALPLLDIGDKMGGTDYIDFIRCEDMSAPVMVGTDSFKRKFVAMRIHVPIESGHSFVLTPFQRYTDSAGFWSYGVLGEVPGLVEHLIQSGRGLSDHKAECIALLCELLRNGNADVQLEYGLKHFGMNPVPAGTVLSLTLV